MARISLYLKHIGNLLLAWILVFLAHGMNRGLYSHESVAGAAYMHHGLCWFGRWVQSLPGSIKDKGVLVINRAHGESSHSYDDIRLVLKSTFWKFSRLPRRAGEWSEAALRTAKQARWGELIEGYMVLIPLP